ncbi:MAG: carbamoyl-phosphate synthase large subunit [Sulfobacillus sp.]
MAAVRDQRLRKVAVIGSGPIVIGQAAEFDYAGTQACRALAEEGVEVVLINSNPATIMTDPEMAARVYLEPLTVPSVSRVLERERPDGLIATLGGQMGLNLAVGLAEAGVLEALNVRLLGTNLTAIRQAEDRQAFRQLMLEIGQPIPRSLVVESVAAGQEFAATIGYPVIVRPAYTLGGTGGGFADQPQELAEVLGRGLALSPIHQCLIEESIAGWIEVEYEVMRDSAGNAITVCNMENIDPVGVHTGDSIVVAPSLTLTDHHYQLLRSAALSIVHALKVEGGCNVQFGLQPDSSEYRVIEVNPRVSRSSALASKATGYPIARMAAKIAIGYTLAELTNPVTGETTACFEPALDYVVVKIPRWPFDKFVQADRRLGTQMKATGEVMAIDRSFGGALQKAIRALEAGQCGLFAWQVEALDDHRLAQALSEPDDHRLFAVAAAFRRNWDLDQVAQLSRIRPYFLEEIRALVAGEQSLPPLAEMSAALWQALKRQGYADRRLAECWGSDEATVRAARWASGVHPVYKMVDTCAGEFLAKTPYFYACYDQQDEAEELVGERVLVIGSGPIRIGQGIEFDFSTVHALSALRQRGVRGLIVNSNPETVSTDFSESDRLFFEPVTLEDVLEVCRHEQVSGVLVQFGGQTALNMAAHLEQAGIRILGTPLAGLWAAEDRGQFDTLLAGLDIRRPLGRAVDSREEALAAAQMIGYPVLVRPSFVLGGRAMQIAYDPHELSAYLDAMAAAGQLKALLVDQYCAGIEVEVDALSDGEQVLVAGIMEHIERAGVHSGDSMAVYPAHSLGQAQKEQVAEITRRIAVGLGVKGLLNVQFVVSDGEILVIEANPRASRTIPFLEKVAGIKLAELATHLMMGDRLSDHQVPGGIWPEPMHVGIKVPVFSWAKLGAVDAALGPEMKSTGEVLGLDATFEGALVKAFEASGFAVAEGSAILLTVADRDKEEVVALAEELAARRFRLLATGGTASALERRGVEVERVAKIGDGHPDILDLIASQQVSLVVNTITRGHKPERDGFRIRRAAVEHGVACITSLDTVRAVLHALSWDRRPRTLALQDYLAELPGSKAGGSR